MGGWGLVVFLAPSGEFLLKRIYSARAKFKSQCSRKKTRPLWVELLTDGTALPPGEKKRVFCWVLLLVVDILFASEKFTRRFFWQWNNLSFHSSRIICRFLTEGNEINIKQMWSRGRKTTILLATCVRRRGAEDETPGVALLSRCIETTKESFTCAWAMCSCSVAAVWSGLLWAGAALSFCICCTHLLPLNQELKVPFYIWSTVKIRQQDDNTASSCCSL